MPEVTHQSERRMISITPRAHDYLQKLRDRLEAEVEKHPEMYPGYLDRRLTYSDLICLIHERCLPNE